MKIFCDDYENSDYLLYFSEYRLIVFVEDKDSELVKKQLRSDEEVYDMYNEFAFKLENFQCI